MHLVPYLNFDGDCRTAFESYARILGGKIEMMQTHAESPMKDHSPPAWHDKILHARLVVDGQMLFGSDLPPDSHDKPQGIWVSIMVTDETQAERIFAALAEGGKIHMPIQQTFWAKRFGMVVDRFGTPWMMNCGVEGVGTQVAG